MTRRRTLTVTALAVIGIAAASAVKTPTKLIWNATASAPVGFYTVEPADRIDVPELVAIMPPEPLASFMVERGYIARGVPLLKRVLGLPGQRVCRAGRTITVDGIEMGEALERDSLGRDLPVWQGCRVIGGDQLFLMNWEVRDSLDGRYFGPIPADSVIGRAVPLWTDEEGVGRYEWRAPTHCPPPPRTNRRRFPMAEIGTFTRTETGYAGELHSFGLHEKLFIVPAKPSDVKNAPDYRLRLDSEDGPDAGPAWKDSSENAGEFVSMRLEGPIFPFPIRAKLFQSNDDPSVWTLRWKHARKIEDEE